MNNLEKVKRTIKRLAEETPQRSPRTRDARGRQRQEFRNMIHAYTHGYAADLES